MPSNKKKPLVVGLTGGSASGKSELAAYLKRELGEDAVIVCQDWYYQDLKHLSEEEVQKVNVDHPDAIENSLFLRHVEELLAGRPVESPRYDYATHSRREATVPIAPAKVLILDGLFILHHPRLYRKLDISVYIDVPDDIRLLRRVRRDSLERNVDLAETLRLYEFCVRPMHEKFIAPAALKAAKVWRQMNGQKDFPKKLLSEIRSRLKKR